MSLDVYLEIEQEPTTKERAMALLRENGFNEQADFIEWRMDDDENRRRKYDANITHNLGAMAKAAGIYEACWRPEEIGITHARQLIEPLRKGLQLLQSDPARFEKFNAPNGWGMYEHFVPWVSQYLSACEEYPDAKVSVSR
jgi:hypothetical protein